MLNKGKRRSGTVLAGLIAAVSMTTVDQTIVSVSSQTIASGLGLDSPGIEWVVNAYLLAAAAAFPLGGKMADAWGYRRIMLAGIALFSAGSALCGATPAGLAQPWIVAARVVQGVGAALMFPAAVGILIASSKERDRAKSMALFFAITGAMTAIGPVAGSWLVQYSWRYIFFVNLPLALIASGLVLVGAGDVERAVGAGEVERAAGARDGEGVVGAGSVNAADLRDEKPADRAIDWAGAAIAALAMGLLILPLKKGGDVGWADPRILASFGGSLALFLCFFLLERRTARPVVDVGAFANRAFTLSALATLVASAVFIPLMYFVSVYGQLSLGLTVGRASGLILAFFVGFLAASQFGARIFDKRGIAAVVLIGGAVAAIGFILLWLRAAGSASGLPAAGDLAWQLGCAGAGIGFMFSPAATDMVNRAAESAYGETTSISQSMKNLGGALGMAVFASVSVSKFADAVYRKLGGFGITRARASELAAKITSGHAQSGRLPGGGGAKRAAIDAVRKAYAEASGSVFLAMAIACALLIVIALLYPRSASPTRQAKSQEERMQ